MADVGVESLGEGQEHHHDVGADVLVVYLASVGHDYVAGYQRLVIVPCPRSRLWAGDPPEVLAALEQLGNDVPEGGVALLYDLHRLADASA